MQSHHMSVAMRDSHPIQGGDKGTTHHSMSPSMNPVVLNGDGRVQGAGGAPDLPPGVRNSHAAQMPPSQQIKPPPPAPPIPGRFDIRSDDSLPLCIEPNRQHFYSDRCFFTGAAALVRPSVRPSIRSSIHGFFIHSTMHSSVRDIVKPIIH